MNQVRNRAKLSPRSNQYSPKFGSKNANARVIVISTMKMFHIPFWAYCVQIFTTMIEHAAPATADYGDLSATGLAAISRELSANNSVGDITRHVGGIDSLNCELGLAAPFPLKSLHPEPERDHQASTTSASVSLSPLMLGGAGAAAAIGGAIAIRRRRAGAPDGVEPDQVQPDERQAPGESLS
mgnify:CR=1 FL=1